MPDNNSIPHLDTDRLHCDEVNELYYGIGGVCGIFAATDQGK